ncbi:MAG: hypothetical protein XD78_1584 [Desulfotomaculum sp. 46_296]|nr:MAG: hypothetical protein XD78_1584 [Desulfotomaculum sp. 46_296]
MAERKELILKIVGKEFVMFQNVKDMYGRASCQDNPKTFKIMRTSQFTGWSTGALESYLNDLDDAAGSNRNLLAEKYARMMQSTLPLKYFEIKHLLPELDQETILLVNKIVAIEVEWQKAAMNKYPDIVGRGRPIYSSQDSSTSTSMETYIRGELLTYSRKTLDLYYQNCLRLKSKGINGAVVTLLAMVKMHGYGTLEEANEKIRAKSGFGVF